MRLLVIVWLILMLISCGPPIRMVGLYNNTGSEVLIETYPQITYNGSYEKYIDLYPDSTGRGRSWIVADVNAIIVYPRGLYQQPDTLAKYVMQSKSGFELGSAFSKSIGPKDLKISYLKILTKNDMIVAEDVDQIWVLLNYDKRKKRDRNIRYDKAIVLE